LRQLETDLGRLACKESVRDLHQDAGAVTSTRIGTDRAAMLQIAENVERVENDLMRLLAFYVGDKADPARILFETRIVHALSRRTEVVLAPRLIVVQSGGRFGIGSRRQRICHDVFTLQLRPAHLASSQISKGLASSAHLGRPAVPTGPPLVRCEP